LFHYREVAIFGFFKIATAAILDFLIREILLATGAWLAPSHHCVKFRQNWSISCGDIVIFRIFKMVDASFCQKFYWLTGFRESRRITVPNFIETVNPFKIFRFFKMAAVRRLGLVWGVCGPPTESTWWSLSLCQI